jgi:hypothetical protein
VVPSSAAWPYRAFWFAGCVSGLPHGDISDRCALAGPPRSPSDAEAAIETFRLLVTATAVSRAGHRGVTSVFLNFRAQPSELQSPRGQAH